MPTKIMHIIPSLAKGGAERMVIDICIELQKKENIEILLVTFQDVDDYTYITADIPKIVCEIKFELSIFKKPKIEINSLHDVIKSFNPDIIHTHLYEADFITKWITYPKIKYITHLHSNMPQLHKLNIIELIKKETWTNFYEKYILIRNYLRCNNYFIAVSKNTEQYISQRIPLSLRKNIVLLPNAINQDRFKSKQRENKSSSNIRIINIGNLNENKDQAFLIDVVKYIKDKNIKIFLQIIGEGILKGKLNEKISKENLDNEIKLIGKVDDVENYLMENDIYVHSSHSESFGLVFIEAMTYGLPVVSTDGKGNQDIIKNDYNGYIVSDRSVKEFAEKIIELHSNVEIYKKMSENARELASKYDIKDYSDRLIHFYSTI